MRSKSPQFSLSSEENGEVRQKDALADDAIVAAKLPLTVDVAD